MEKTKGTLRKGALEREALKACPITSQQNLTSLDKVDKFFVTWDYSVTSKKSPIVYKVAQKLISLAKWKIPTTLQTLSKMWAIWAK